MNATTRRGHWPQEANTTPRPRHAGPRMHLRGARRDPRPHLQHPPTEDRKVNTPMPSPYADWTPADWTCEALIGEIKDICPTTELNDARVEIVDATGHKLAITGIWDIDGDKVVITLGGTA